jgi:hypothetical protein
MRRTLGIIAALALLSAAPSMSPAGPPPAPPPPPPPPSATCVFTNPGFSGKCTEIADVPRDGTPAQACQAILQCLNDVDCLKTYCQATTIRGGWQLESVK